MLLHKVVTHKCRLFASSRLCHWLKLAAFHSGLKSHNAANNTPATVSIVPLHTASTCYTLSLESTVLHCKHFLLLALLSVLLFECVRWKPTLANPQTHIILQLCTFVSLYTHCSGTVRHLQVLSVPVKYFITKEPQRFQFVFCVLSATPCCTLHTGSYSNSLSIGHDVSV